MAGNAPATQESAFQWIENFSMSASAIYHSSRVCTASCWHEKPFPFTNFRDDVEYLSSQFGIAVYLIDAL
jgi:hypothetical protein